MGAPMWAIRACCSTAAACGRAAVFTEAVDARAPSRGDDVPVVETLDAAPEREPRLAHHEAGHAIVGLALGAEVEAARIGGSDSAVVRFGPGSPLSARCAVLIAGQIAENWSLRHISRPHDEELLWHLGRVRDLDFGQCDICKVALAIVADDPGASDEALARRYRAIETVTIGLVRRPDVWRAIRAVADALMTQGELTGAEIRALVDVEPVDLGAAL